MRSFSLGMKKKKKLFRIVENEFDNTKFFVRFLHFDDSNFLPEIWRKIEAVVGNFEKDN